VSDAADQANQANDQARFAAREFVARFERETGGKLPPVILDRMLFAFEIGYLRGRGEGMRAASTLYDELRKKANDVE
jgi:hypothetical protein